MPTYYAYIVHIHPCIHKYNDMPAMVVGTCLRHEMRGHSLSPKTIIEGRMGRKATRKTKNDVNGRNDNGVLQLLLLLLLLHNKLNCNSKLKETAGKR